MKILAQHGEPGMLGYIRSALMQAGHEVECIETAEQAMNAYLQKGPFDVVLAQFSTGADFLRSVRKENPLQSMILVSSSPIDVTLPLINELELPVLETPFRAWELIEVVEF